MTTEEKMLPRERAVSPASRRTLVAHWTRDEQIENAKEDDTIADIAPPLSPEERRKHEL